MKKDWVLTQDAFDRLLDWLDPDREVAGRKYEAIRLRLIKIFTCRGCSEVEDLADETINRVAARVGEIATDYQGEPAVYFYGVAQKVYLEHLRKVKVKQAEVPVESSFNDPAMRQDCFDEDIEPSYECLEHCLEHLPSSNRQLVLEYYRQERKAKIDHRKLLAAELGIAVNALRIRAHRIRRSLEQCVHACLEQQPAH
jgi:DNA-directed RNA polymerase specialized sigma24 family protein